MDTSRKNVTVSRGFNLTSKQRRNSIARLRQFARLNKRFTSFHLLLACYGLIVVAGIIYQVVRHIR